MRMLFSTTGNEGHFGPLVPLAGAAASAGHEVRVAAPVSFAGSVRRAGFDHIPFADAPADLVGPVMARLPSMPFSEADATVIRDVFGRIDAQAALPDLTLAMAHWRPHVLVREPAELGSLAAAERTGVPHLQVAIGMAELSRRIRDLIAEPLAELSLIAGLPGDALGAALAAEAQLTLVPDVLDRAGDPAYDSTLVAFRFRDATPTATSAAPLPDWGNLDLPLVYVTFGSVTGSVPPFAGVFREALDGLADLPARVLMTVGRRVDIAGLGPVPPNARVEAWWPQSEVLSRAALVLGHGGFGTTMGALAAGVPQVIAPLFTSDQAVNARHVQAVGAGQAVAPGVGAATLACGEVAAVLADPGYRTVARAVAEAIGALAPAAEAVAVIERFAA